METYNSIEVTKQLVKDGKISQEIAETIFPQLKESEDEKIRKAILELVKQSSHILNPMNQKSMIAWLEKQGSQNLANSAKTCKDEQNPAWSEEDENKLKVVISFVNSNPAEDPFYDKGCLKDWLKSLKFRIQPQWKPNDEQMDALDDFIYAKYPNIEKHGAAVKSLYQDLKKLK